MTEAKTLGEMTPEERRAAIQRVTARLAAELQANADVIGKIMDGEVEDA
jgi:hypothetical protein